MTVPERYLEDVLSEFHKYKQMTERALAQIDDEAFFAALDAEANSVAVLVKHMAGNMHSRWRDFLTSDGEKADRRRDTEFVIEAGDTRPALMERWETGWQQLFDAIEALDGDDLLAVVRIRGQDHTVLQAINRQLTHLPYHVGQIVLLAKHARSQEWETLSIARGQSEQYNVQMMGAAH